MCNDNTHYVHCKGCAALVRSRSLDCEGRCPVCEIVEKMLDNEVVDKAIGGFVSDEL